MRVLVDISLSGSIEIMTLIISSSVLSLSGSIGIILDYSAYYEISLFIFVYLFSILLSNLD